MGQLELQLNKVAEASPAEVREWRQSDFFSKGDFDPLIMFVVIPTIIQMTCILGMFAVITIVDKSGL